MLDGYTFNAAVKGAVSCNSRDLQSKSHELQDTAPFYLCVRGVKAIVSEKVRSSACYYMSLPTPEPYWHLL